MEESSKNSLIELVEQNPFYLSAKIQEIENKLDQIDRLIIILADYDVGNEKNLTTHWAVAAKIINNDSKISRKVETVKKKQFSRYVIEESDIKGSGIKTTTLWNPQGENMTGITLFESISKASPKVVVVPIPNILLIANEKSESAMAPSEKKIKEIKDKYADMLLKLNGNERTLKNKEMDLEI